MEKLGDSKIALIGGTGKAGSPVLNQLLRTGYTVKMLVRNPDKVKFTDNRLDIVQGDAREISSIQTLLLGCHTVISTLGQPKGEQPIFNKSTSNILSTMKELDIKRYILITGMGVDAYGDSKSFKDKFKTIVLRSMFPAILSDKQREYETLLKSDIQWTLVRLPLIVEGYSTGNIKVDMKHTPGSKIDSLDLAEFLVNQIIDTKNICKAPFISN